MSISSVAPGPDAFDPLRDIRSLAARNPAPPPTPGQAAATIQALSKAEVAKDAAQARANPMFQAQDSRKTQARAKLQQIREWLKIVKKLYAQNPKGMAQAVAQVVKDLKAALKEYADAGGREMGMSDEAVTATLAPAAKPEDAEKARNAQTADAHTADGKTGEVDADQPKPEDAATGDQAAPARAPADAANLYGAVSDAVRKVIGEDGLEFLKEVREMAQDVKDLLASARIQAAAHRRDKSTDKAFEDADKAFKDLDDAMHDTERDIRQAAPDVGMRLSVTG
ncbi:MAG: hypothetical protein JSR45_17980 [Proteobacteria bacterium]|nr:hypothetical protein [Pseudomonadota bacterium]